MKAKASKSGRKSPIIPSKGKSIPTTKIGKKTKVKKVMDEWKDGKLKTNAGKTVKDQKQAIAIALSESGQSYKDGKKGVISKIKYK